MSDWKIELGPEVPLLAEVLQAQQVWKRLTKPARAAGREVVRWMGKP